MQAVGRSARDFGSLATGTVGALGKLLSFQGVMSYADQVQGKEVSQEDQGNRFLSPVGVYQIAGSAADQGLGQVAGVHTLAADVGLPPIGEEGDPEGCVADHGPTSLSGC